MAFSADVKEELMRLETGGACCVRAELAALTQTLGALSFRGGGHFSVVFSMDSAALARHTFSLLKEGLGLQPQLRIEEHSRFGGRKTCVLTVSGEDAPMLLGEMDMMATDDDGASVLRRTAPHPNLSRQCCRSAWLRGAFLGCGCAHLPAGGYELEWACPEGSLAGGIARQLERLSLHPGLRERRQRTVVYLKSFDAIADALTFMGCTRARFQLEELRANRQLRGRINRAANCDEHNDQRRMDASEAQVRAITLLSVERGLFTLPPALREIAEHRLSHPEMGLQELGEICQPPVGKSAVNSRLRRLMRLAEETERALTASPAPEKPPR